MKFFIDSADIREIKEAASMGIIDGVTTNPSLVAKMGRKFRDVLLEICDVVRGPVSAEVVSTKVDGMMQEARELAALRPNIVVKIPLIPDYVAGREGDDLLLTNFENGLYRYPDPDGRLGSDRDRVAENPLVGQPGSAVQGDNQ